MLIYSHYLECSFSYSISINRLQLLEKHLVAKGLAWYNLIFAASEALLSARRIALQPINLLLKTPLTVFFNNLDKWIYLMDIFIEKVEGMYVRIVCVCAHINVVTEQEHLGTGHWLNVLCTFPLINTVWFMVLLAFWDWQQIWLVSSNHYIKHCWLI